jgi:hypothetical protein
MKTLKTVLLAVAITFGTAFTANASSKAEPTPDQKEVIAKKFENILKYPEFDVLEETLVQVTVGFNENDEMVILEVDSENENVSSYLERTLKFHKFAVDGFRNIEEYVLPIKLVPLQKS